MGILLRRGLVIGISLHLDEVLRCICERDIRARVLRLYADDEAKSITKDVRIRRRIVLSYIRLSYTPLRKALGTQLQVV